jgi:hypothetical protein
MKAAIRASILLAAAGGFCVALSLSARADVVEPSSAYQPASVGLIQKNAPPASDMPEPAKVDPKKTEPEVVLAPREVEATPAPEQQVVRQVPTTIMQPSVVDVPSVADRVVHPLRIGLEHIRASLGRVVSACAVGFGTGAGGPALVLAVLSIVIPFARRRVTTIRWAADEDVPEFLFAWELTPPG